MIFVATAKYDLRSLKVLFSGAAPLGSTLVNAVRSKMKSVGAECDVSQGQSDITVPLGLADTVRLRTLRVRSN